MYFINDFIEKLGHCPRKWIVNVRIDVQIVLLVQFLQVVLDFIFAFITNLMVSIKF